MSSPKVKNINLIIGILSCRKFRRRRDYIRKTWGRKCRSLGIDYYFIIGRPGQPSEIIGDRLYVDAGDHYEDLPRKSYEFIKYCFENLEFDWLFKTDDDVYLKFPRFLRTRLLGDYCGNIVCKRGMRGKWHQGKCHNDRLNKTKYQGEHLGPWCGGPGYFLSHDACEVISGFINDEVIDGELYEDKMVGDILRAEGILGQNLKKYYRNIHRVSDLKTMPANCSVLHLDLKEKERGILKGVFEQVHARKFPVRVKPTRRLVKSNRK